MKKLVLTVMSLTLLTGCYATGGAKKQAEADKAKVGTLKFLSGTSGPEHQIRGAQGSVRSIFVKVPKNTKYVVVLDDKMVTNFKKTPKSGKFELIEEISGNSTFEVAVTNRKPSHSDSLKTVKPIKWIQGKTVMTKLAKEESTSSSSSSVASTPAKKKIEISGAASLKELKAVVSFPMDKSQYLTLEAGALKAMTVDDIAHPEQTGAYKHFQSVVNNLNNKADEATKISSGESKHLTSADLATLKQYGSALSDYLSTLGEYATTYQTDMPSIHNTKNDSGLVKDLQTEIAAAKAPYVKAKNVWLTSYDAIMSR